MRKVEMIMGMPVSIDIPNAHSAQPFQVVFDFLKNVDTKYSPYKESSEVCRFARGDINEADVSLEFQHILKECTKYERSTGGYFSARYNDDFDPSGYVKAWALHESAAKIEACGFSSFLISIAGDMVARSDTSIDAKVWNIGIQDPHNQQQVLGAVHLKNQAIATSGSYVRGAHIFDPHTHSTNTDLLSVTIYGPDIITADVFATTCMAMGYKTAVRFLRTQPQYAALLITHDNALHPMNRFMFSS